MADLKRVIRRVATKFRVLDKSDQQWIWFDLRTGDELCRGRMIPMSPQLITTVRSIYRKCQLELQERDTTPVIIASSFGLADMVWGFIQCSKQARTNIHAGEYLFTEESLDFLWLRDRMGNTALDLAISFNYVEVAKILLSYAPSKNLASAWNKDAKILLPLLHDYPKHDSFLFDKLEEETRKASALHSLTVTGGLKLDKSEPRTNVLVTAASGGVGHYAVQLAKLGNTHVTGTCGARNIEFVKSLGADEVLDYKTPEGAALKSPSGQKYDIVIDCATGIPWSTFEPNLSSSGKVINITPSASVFWTYAMNKITFSKKQLLPLLVTPNTEEIGCLLKLVKEGKLKTVIDSKYPLSRAEEAWAKSIEGHVTGKVVVENSFGSQG